MYVTITKYPYLMLDCERRAEMERRTQPGYEYHSCDFMDDGLYIDMNLLREYEDTDLTPAEIMELKERDKPKLVVYEHEFEDNRLISYVQRCESCGEAYDPSERFNFCPNCGQRIKWEE